MLYASQAVGLQAIISPFSLPSFQKAVLDFSNLSCICNIATLISLTDQKLLVVEIFYSLLLQVALL